MATKIETRFGTLSITEHDSKHKMAGFQSLNTSVSQNPFCQKMRDTENTVCQKCFASKMLNRYKSMEVNSIENGKILSENTFKVEDMPYINATAFRLHSTGELINETHFHNYLNLCVRNPDTILTLWTKRVHIVHNVLEFCDKPKNLILIYSSPSVNKESMLPEYFDKTFTVYNKEYIKTNDVDINCGSKSCLGCMLCYTHNDVKVIKELIR